MSLDGFAKGAGSVGKQPVNPTLAGGNCYLQEWEFQLGLLSISQDCQIECLCAKFSLEKSSTRLRGAKP